ncbi:TEAD3 factor, partial [Pomatorhinus ruficollis]|nr:TEAD3 factor [Pomatorhinus ruficollis]
VSSHIQVLARKKVREYQVGIKVSSHLQVLARRKSREIQSKLKDQVSKDKALQSMASMSSAQIVSASVLQNKLSPPPPLPQAVFSAAPRFWSGPIPGQPGPSQDIKPFAQPAYPIQPPMPPSLASKSILGGSESWCPVSPSRDGCGGASWDSFPLSSLQADLNSTIQDGPGTFYGVSSQYSSAENMTITVSTKVCSFGKQVVEKVETEYARLENGRFVYRIHRSPMCEYMINFIHKLKHLPEKYMMNSVLENFTILQVVTNRDTQETLLCIAFVFEVSTSEHGAQHHVYKLVKD